MIPVVDIFAGPGGLGEGFSAFAARGRQPFDVSLSIEKDPIACETLILRKFFHLFESPPPEIAAYAAGSLTKEELFTAFPAEAEKARERAWNVELGKVPARSVAARVKKAIGACHDWVLLGGPPCQAYSIVGRARMKNTRTDFEQDERHLLYREYLRIVADHEPAVFVLENVKGLLSSRHGGSRIVSRILDDLGAPGKVLGISRRKSLRYRLYALGQKQSTLPWMDDSPLDGEEFLLQAEEYGIPQMRHRIFIVGVRSDVSGRPDLLERKPEVSTGKVLSDLPAIRSALSRGRDSPGAWADAIASIRSQEWLTAPSTTSLGRVVKEVQAALKVLAREELSPGVRYSAHDTQPSALANWYRQNVSGITLHESRSHMPEDLHRYLFCACFAKAHNRSPQLRDFPPDLHPSHKNVSLALDGQMFGDRFRVQIEDRPSTTITSHVSKDGHYYIHYDPNQCRSLSVREAARLQTFPDNYYFEGGRTDQYHQIGNAVPPLLARDIARVVFDLLKANETSMD